MIRLLLLTALIALQTTAPGLAQQLCAFTTDGTGQSMGLKIKFTVPCTWEGEDSKGKALRSYQYEDGDAGILATYTISNPAKPVTPTRIDELASADNYKKLGEKDGTFLWGTKRKIDGQDCAEVALKMKKKVLFTTLYMYVVRYMMYHKNKAITINYMITAENEQDAKKYFNTYKTTFRNLATATHLLD